MNTYEIIKELAKERKISIRQLEKVFGYSNGYIGSWKRQNPNSTELARLADYFGVSVDYLLGRESLSEDDIPDLADDSAIFAFDGKPVSDEERAFLKSVIESYRKNKK